MDPKLQTELVNVAHELADCARVETLKVFRGNALETQSKEESVFDPVTQADRAAEEAMRARLAKLRSDDGILGEEFGPKPSSSGLTWVLDPIDGTRGYVSGTPTWGVLIAVHDGNAPVLGVIDQPYIAERFTGGLGVAEMSGPLGPRALRTRDNEDLSAATIFTTFPEVGTAQDRAGFEAVASKCQLTRYGMDCYAYALLAAGQIDLVIEAGLQAYDIQAPIAVVEAAGGIVTNWEGGPADQGGRALAASNRALHAQALEILANV